MKKISHFAYYVAMATMAFLTFTSFASAQHEMNEMNGANNSRLPQLVRDATEKFLDVNNAVAAGYGPLFGCVSGPDHGAMGIHYVNAAYLNGTIELNHPQALIYEPSDGKLKLVGVEYIADAATWLKSNSAPPVLEGQVFLFVDAPNRYTAASFFELHVWAWRNNPRGAFVDWNDRVTCAGQ